MIFLPTSRREVFGGDLPQAPTPSSHLGLNLQTAFSFIPTDELPCSHRRPRPPLPRLGLHPHLSRTSLNRSPFPLPHYQICLLLDTAMTFKHTVYLCFLDLRPSPITSPAFLSSRNYAVSNSLFKAAVSYQGHQSPLC